MGKERHNYLERDKIKLKEEAKKEALARKYADDIHFLAYKNRLPLTTCIAVTFRSLSNIGKLHSYLKETKYDIFRWSLERDNLNLIDKLIQLLDERRAFLMIAYDNYLAIRNYINGIFQLDIETYKEAIQIKYPILKRVIGVKLDPIYELVKEIIAENKEKEVANIFLQDIEKIIAELPNEAIQNTQIINSETYVTSHGLFSNNPPPIKRARLEKIGIDYTDESQQQQEVKENIHPPL